MNNTKSSIPPIDLECPMHTPTQSPKHAIHTSKHEYVLEKAYPKPNSPNCSFISIDSDIDSLEKMIFGFEQQA